MALDNFSFPSVTLKQSFAASATSGVATLGAAVIGSMFKLHRHDQTAEAAQLATEYIGSSLTATVPGSPSNIDSDTSAQHLCVVDGVFSYATETSRPIALVSGLAVVTSAKKLAAGASACSTEFGTRGVKVGDTVILTGTDSESASVTVKTKVIALIADSDGEYTKFAVESYGDIEIGDSTTVGVDYCLVEDCTYEQGSDKFSINTSAKTITISSGLNKDVKDTLGKTTETTGTLKSAYPYVEYRERVSTYVNSRGAVSAVGDIETVAGPIDPENPLALALYFAVGAAGGNYVYFSAVSAETVAGYTSALSYLSKYNNVYSVVPATTDTAIIQALAADVISVSENEHSKIRRSLWYGIDCDDEIVEYTGTAVFTAGVSGADDSLQLTSIVFSTYGFQTGDVIRYNGSDYTINSTNGLNVARVTNGSIPGATGTLTGVQVVRTQPSTSQLVDILVGKRCTTSYRCQCVFADDILYNKEVVSNYCGAAAAAGMRSYEECWRPMSNLGYSHFSVNDTHGFTLADLESLGSYGVWIIDENDDGTPVNKKAITTAIANNVNMDNESIISNIDEIALVMCHVGEDKIGNSNISDLLLMCLRDDIDRILNYRTMNATNDYVGNQLLDYEITDVWQDETNLDEVYADMTVTPPKPFNQFHMTMRVL